MAKSKQQEETTEEATERVPGARSQTQIHQGQVDYVSETYGINLDELSAAEVISIAYATRNEWRGTDTYRELKDSVKAEAAEARESKAQERAARKAERAAKAAEEGAKEKPTKASKSAKKAEKDAPKKATRGGKGKAASTEENPFD